MSKPEVPIAVAAPPVSFSGKQNVHSFLMCETSSYPGPALCKAQLQIARPERQGPELLDSAAPPRLPQRSKTATWVIYEFVRMGGGKTLFYMSHKTVPLMRNGQIFV